MGLTETREDEDTAADDADDDETDRDATVT